MSDKTSPVINKIYDLNHQYKLYLERVDLHEEKMHEVQKQQIKQTFMAACGQMLILLEADISALTEEDAIKALESMKDQVSKYFSGLFEDKEPELKIIKP